MAAHRAVPTIETVARERAAAADSGRISMLGLLISQLGKVRATRRDPAAEALDLGRST